MSVVNTAPIGHDRQGFEMETATRRSLLLSALATAAVASPSKKFRVAVIGHTGRGNYGHGIDTVWNAFSQIEVVGVADPDEKGRAGALAAAKSFHLPSGFTLTKPAISWHSDWMNAGPLALSSTSFKLASRQRALNWRTASKVAGKSMRARTWSRRYRSVIRTGGNPFPPLLQQRPWARAA